MSALDKIARHLNFYGVASQKQESRGKNQEQEVVGCELPVVGLDEEEVAGCELPGASLDEEEVEGFGLPFVDLDQEVFDGELVVVSNEMEAVLIDSPVMQSGKNESGPSLEGPDLVFAKILLIPP